MDHASAARSALALKPSTRSSHQPMGLVFFLKKRGGGCLDDGPRSGRVCVRVCACGGAACEGDREDEREKEGAAPSSARVIFFFVLRMRPEGPTRQGGGRPPRRDEGGNLPPVRAPERVQGWGGADDAAAVRASPPTNLPGDSKMGEEDRESAPRRKKTRTLPHNLARAPACKQRVPQHRPPALTLMATALHAHSHPGVASARRPASRRSTSRELGGGVGGAPPPSTRPALARPRPVHAPVGGRGGSPDPHRALPFLDTLFAPSAEAAAQEALVALVTDPALARGAKGGPAARARVEAAIDACIAAAGKGDTPPTASSKAINGGEKRERERERERWVEGGGAGRHERKDRVGGHAPHHRPWFFFACSLPCRARAQTHFPVPPPPLTLSL